MVTTRQTKARVTRASHRRPRPEPDSSVKKFFKVVLPSTVKRNMLVIDITLVDQSFTWKKNTLHVLLLVQFFVSLHLLGLYQQIC